MACIYLAGEGASQLRVVVTVATMRVVVDTGAGTSAKKLAKAMGEICKGTGVLYISLQVGPRPGFASVTSLLASEGSPAVVSVPPRPVGFGRPSVLPRGHGRRKLGFNLDSPM